MFTTVSRRRFVGGLAAALGYFGTHGDLTVAGQAPTIRPARTRPRFSIDEYDAAAKLAYNENPYGPSEPVVKAMTEAFRFENRYGYPDGDIVQTIADHHGVKPENLLLGAGSSEILQVAGRAFLPGGRKVVGVEPTFADVDRVRVGHPRGVDHPAARGRLPPGHPRARPRHARQSSRRRLRLSLHTEQPHRYRGHEAGGTAIARRRPRGCARAHRRGVSPLRRASRLRDVDAGT